MNVLVVGAKGNLGSALMREATRRGFAVHGVDREELDVTSEQAIAEFFLREASASNSFDLIVNATAYNNVDAAETPEGYALARAVNGVAPGLLADAAERTGAAFVHYSSDYVFEGAKPEGYRENDEPKPVSRYGETKLEGERAVAAVGGRFFICRSSKLFGPKGSALGVKKSFVDMMLELAQTKPELTLIETEVGSPTYTLDLATATFDLVLGPFEHGIYHLVNEGRGVSWYDFAEEFFALKHVTTPRRRITSADLPRPAKRPEHAPLVNTKFPPLRPRVEALKKYLGEIGEIAR